MSPGRLAIFEGMPQDQVSITLSAAEWQLVITTLKNTGAILLALASLRGVLPDDFESPITSHTISNIIGLAQRIESQSEP
jgi:hypothetical protein